MDIQPFTRRSTPILFVVVLASGCGDGASVASSPFSDAVETVRLEVDYASGAAPYTASAGSADPWTLFGTQVDRLFGGKEVIYPSTLAEMEALVDVGPGPYTVDALLSVADRHRDALPSATEFTYYALWLDGFIELDGQTERGVLGVSIGDTGVIALFKPVIAQSARGDGVRRFVEQTTLIHELGHALGLVNNGLPLQSSHHDEENGAHCTNQSCIMYWLNEGASDLVQFVRQFVQTGENPVLFGPECLEDVDAARE